MAVKRAVPSDSERVRERVVQRRRCLGAHAPVAACGAVAGAGAPPGVSPKCIFVSQCLVTGVTYTLHLSCAGCGMVSLAHVCVSGHTTYSPCVSTAMDAWVYVRTNRFVISVRKLV